MCSIIFFIILSRCINSGARDSPLSLYVCNSWHICIQCLQIFVDTCKYSHTCESRWLFSSLSWNMWPTPRFSQQRKRIVVYGQWTQVSLVQVPMGRKISKNTVEDSLLDLYLWQSDAFQLCLAYLASQGPVTSRMECVWIWMRFLLVT